MLSYSYKQNTIVYIMSRKKEEKKQCVRYDILCTQWLNNKQQFKDNM